MRDTIINAFGGWKEYEMEMASSFIGLGISKLLFHNKSDQDEDIAYVMELLLAYDLSDHYEDEIWSSSYYYFKFYNLPLTLNIIKNATKRGVLDREKWMPCLELFFNKTKEFLAEIPEGYEEYVESLHNL